MKKKETNCLQLVFMGVDDFDMPTYKDQHGHLWKDINLGNCPGPDLYSVTNDDLDGEPLFPIRKRYSFGEAGPYKNNPHKFEYMMLSRMQSDCEYFLGYGNRSTYALHEKTVDEHISRMKELWNGFPDNEKPEWLPWEQILEYEMAMGSDPEKVRDGCDKLRKRGVFIL